MSKREYLLVAAAVAAALLPAAAGAQLNPVPGPGGYPTKPVRVLVGSPAGSGSDVMMRAVAQKMTERLGQSVIVDNRPGATGAISLQLAAQAAPDGYTLATLSAQNVTAMLIGTVTTDIRKELTAVVLMISQPYLMVATPSLPANSVKELIALAKAKPLVYASSGTGSVVHLGMELFKSMAGVEMTHIPYKGSGLSMIDVMSGRVQLAITNVLTATPLVRGGKLKALAVTSLARNSDLPDLPTVAETLPGYEAVGWQGLMARAGTPKSIVNELNKYLTADLKRPETAERFNKIGVKVKYSSPEEFNQWIRSEIDKWGKVMRDAGIEPQ
jgi:tripartite-type tricarboxylate transporter receptor subunit TctC